MRTSPAARIGIGIVRCPQCGQYLRRGQDRQHALVCGKAVRGGEGRTDIEMADRGRTLLAWVEAAAFVGIVWAACWCVLRVF